MANKKNHSFALSENFSSFKRLINSQSFRSLKKNQFLVATVLLGFIPLLWFRPWETLITGGDFWLPLGTTGTLRSLLSAWLANVSGGQPNSIIFHVFPYFSFWSFFRFLLLPLTHIEKLWFVSLFLTAGISVYFLISEVFQEREGSFKNLVAAAFYLFNLYIMMTGVVTTTLLSYCLTPLSLLFYIRGLKSKTPLSAGLILALLLTLLTSAAGNPPIFLIPFFILFLYFLYFLFTSGFRTAWRFHLTLIAAYLFLNLWWIFLFFKGLIVQIQDVQAITAAATVGSFSNFYDLIRLLGSWAFFAGHQGAAYFPFAVSYLNPVLLSLTFVVPSLALAGYFFHLKKFRSPATFFAGLALLGLLLSHGQKNDLFGNLNAFLKGLIPFFWIYREPFAKFTLLTTLGYTVLLASFFAFLEATIKSRRLLYLLTSATILLILTVAWPEVLGDHYPDARGVLAPSRTQIPNYWFALADFLKGRENEGRLFVLPDNPDWNRSGIPYAWGYDSADVGPHLLTVPWVERNNGFYGLPAAADRLAKIAYRVVDDQYGRPRDLNAVFGLLNVNRLLQRNDVDLVRVGDLSENYSPEHVKAVLGKQGGISLEKTFGALDLYQVKKGTVLPKIYAAGAKLCLTGNVERLEYPLDLEKEDSPKIFMAEKNLDPSQCQKRYIIPVEVFRQGQRIKSLAYRPYFSARKEVLLDYGDQPYLFSEGDRNFGFTVDVPGEYQLTFFADAASSPERFLPAYRLSLLGERYLEQIASGRAARVKGDGTVADLGVHSLAQGKYILAINHPSFSNLIDNPSFENGAWPTSLQNVPVAVSAEALDGRQSMDLGKGTTDAYQRLANLDPKVFYQISFYYKVIEGQPPVFLVWENPCDFDHPVWRSYKENADNSCMSHFIAASPMIKSPDWTKYQFEYRPSRSARKLGLGLVFIDQEGKVRLNQGETLIDDVVVTSKFYGGVALYQTTPAAIEETPTVRISEQSPTFYRVQVAKATGAFPLVFSETYSPDWQAWVVDHGQKVEVPESRHLLVNLYANAWILEKKGDFEVEIAYRPETIFRILLVASMATAVVSGGYLFSTRFLRKKEKRE